MREINQDRKIIHDRLKEADLYPYRFHGLRTKTKVAYSGWKDTNKASLELGNYESIGCNVGNGLFVVDVDEEGYPQINEIFKNTFTVLSGGKGKPHFYGKVVGGELPNKKLVCGDLQAQDKYVVSAGSEIDYQDTNGKRVHGFYKIHKDQPIKTFHYQDLMMMMEPFFKDKTNGKDRLTKEAMKGGVSQGQRHTTGIKLANKMANELDLDYNATYIGLQAWNEKNKPPLPHEEIEQMVVDAINYQKNKCLHQQEELDEKIQTKGYDEPELMRGIFSDLSRRVKHDNITKTSVFATGISAYSPEPLNLFAKGPSGSGKTYNAIETLAYFPQDDIMYLAGLSPKAIVHQKSALLDKEGTPINSEDKPTKPKKSDYGKNKEAYNQAIKEYDKQIEEYNKKIKESYYYINLDNKILVFLETPHHETMRMLYPILSHDKRKIEYRFVNKTNSGLKTELVIIEGFPATIFLTTDRLYVEELATRSLTVSPDSNEEKIKSANEFTNLKVSMPWKCNKETPEFLKIKQLIEDIKTEVYTKEIGVVIPCLNLHEEFPTSVSRDMRDFKHFTQFTKAWTMTHLFQRPCIVVNDKKYILSNNYDLFVCFNKFKELIESTRTGTEKRILDFYRIFLMDKGVSFHVNELTESYNEESKTKLSDYTIRRWLARLNEIGYVQKEGDTDDKRKNIWTPLLTSKDLEKFANTCNSETQINLLSKFEKGVNLWLENICNTPQCIMKEKITSENNIIPQELKDHILLDEKKVLSYFESVCNDLDKSNEGNDS